MNGLPSTCRSDRPGRCRNHDAPKCRVPSASCVSFTSSTAGLPASSGGVAKHPNRAQSTSTRSSTMRPTATRRTNLSNFSRRISAIHIPTRTKPYHSFCLCAMRVGGGEHVARYMRTRPHRSELHGKHNQFSCHGAALTHGSSRSSWRRERGRWEFGCLSTQPITAKVGANHVDVLPQRTGLAGCTQEPKQLRVKIDA